jgi:hypothetical protein
MSTLSLPLTAQLDIALEQLQRRRERLTAEPVDVECAVRIAGLYELEARLWSVLFERSRGRIQWRAALSAEAYARSCARAWKAQAQAYHGPTYIPRTTELGVGERR